MIDPNPLRRRLEIGLLTTASILIAIAALVTFEIHAEQASVAQISNNNLTYAGSSAAVELLRLQRALSRLTEAGLEGGVEDARLHADILIGRAATLAQGKFGGFAHQAPGGPAVIERLSTVANEVRTALDADRSALEAGRFVAALEHLERPLLNLASRANQAGADEVGAGRGKLRRSFDISLWASIALVCCGGVLLALTVDARRRLSASNARLAFLAYHDALTRLPNRAMLMKTLEASRGGMLAILDLDGFKAVNDTHGHGLGDRLLVEVGGRLRDAVGKRAMSARLGGDEFALLSRTDPATFLTDVENAVAKLREPFHVEGITITVGASAGVAFAADGGDTHELMSRADTALYQVKRSGKGRVEVYGDDAAANGNEAARRLA